MSVKGELKSNPSIVEKYNRSGIFCWKLNNKIVYIGMSSNMLNRIASQIYKLNSIKEGKEIDETRYRYEILQEARERDDVSVSFDVIRYCGLNELKDFKKLYVELYRPLLNDRYEMTLEQALRL